jgi:hypothetical protein
MELVNNSNTTTTSQWGTTGTLGSQGLYQGVAPPRQSQAQGIQGTDNRAYTRNVTGNELVQNQMQGLMNRGGAYMQNAARRGMETANRRGLLNSSIASGAAERSSLEAAMPIAQADASTYGRAQTENLDALNRGLMQERDIMNQQTMEGLRAAASGQNAQAQAMLARERMQMELQSQRENLAFQGEMQGLDRGQQQWLAQFGLGADLTRGQQGFGFQSALGQQGFQQDIGRMGFEDYYRSQQGQRDTMNQAYLAEFGAGLNVMNNFYNNFADDFFINPEVYQDPAIRQAVMGFGQTFRPQFMTMFGNMYGTRGG